MQVTVTGNLIEIVKDDGTELVINGANVVDEGGIRWEQYNTAPPILGSDPYTQPTPTKVTRYKITLHFNDNRWETIWMGEVTNQPSWTDDLTGVNNATTYLSAALVVSGGGGGGVSSVSADAPLSSSGGSTPTISIDTTGATAGQALVFDGADVVFDDVTAGAAGVEGSVQFKTGSALDGNGQFIYDSASNDLLIGVDTNVSAAIILGGSGSASGELSAPGDDGLTLAGTVGPVTILTDGDVRLAITADGAFEVAGDAGTAGQLLTSAGASAPPTWEDPPAAAAAGNNTEIQFNNSGVLGASTEFTFNSATNVMEVGVDPDVRAEVIINGTGDDPALLTGRGDGGLFVQTANGPISFAPAGGGATLSLSAAGNWDIQGNAGTAGQVITSQGGGASPVWGGIIEQVWEGYISQSGTDAPVVTELANTLGGAPVFAYDEPGVYIATLTGAFGASRTSQWYGGVQPESVAVGQFLCINSPTANTLRFVSSASSTYTDSLLNGAYFKITVKP